jgi:diguanylate cyclase (GGDEF)-like protein/PAS domain S-box-containing protein
MRKNTSGFLLFFVFICVAIVMAIFEFIKEISFNGGLSIWQSHIITIFVTSSLTTIASYFILQWSKKVNEQLNIAAVTFQSLDAIMITDASLNIIKVNRSFTKITGYTEDEVLGKNPRILGSGKHDNVFFEKLFLSLSTEGSWSGEIWNKRKNGEINPNSMTVTAIKDANNKVQQYVGIFRDITANKLAEEIKHKELTRLNQIASTVPGVIYQYLLRPDGTSALPYASEAIHELFKVAPNEVVEDATKIFEVIHPEDYDELIDSILLSAENHTPWSHECRVCYKDGTIKCLYGNAIPNKLEDGSVVWNGFITDITERKKNEAFLKREVEKNQLFLRNASDGITIMNEAGNLIEFSNSFCNMLGYTREELMGMHVSQWDVGFNNKHELDAIVLNQFLNHQRHQYVSKHRRKDGSIYDVEISGFPLMLDGSLVLFNSSRDITDRKKTEEKLAALTLELNDLYDHAPCGYHSLDEDGVIQNINQTELNWLGLEKEEIIGKKKIKDFFTSESKTNFDKNFPNFKKQGHIENLEYELINKEGFIKDVTMNASAIYDKNGKFIKSRSIFNDITDIKNLQRALSQTAVEQYMLLENDLVGMSKVRDRKIIWANKALNQMFGYEHGELEGASVRILYPNNNSYALIGNAAYPIIKASNIYRTQLELTRKNGDCIWVDLSGQLLPTDSEVTLWMAMNITESVMNQKQVKQIAFHDNLTGLPNRLLISDRLNQILAQVQRTGEILAVCFLDLDEFKPVNDRFGHAAGDKVLIEVAKRIKKIIRTNDTVGRLGGDEYIILLTSVESKDDCKAVLDRLIKSINKPIKISESEKVVVGASIGVTLFPDDSVGHNELLRHADQAMYQAKASGKNRISLFELLKPN